MLHTYLLRRRFVALLCAALAAAHGIGRAQNKAIDTARNPQVEMPAAMREDLQVIGRYAEAVNKRTNPAPGVPVVATESPAAAPAAPGSGTSRRIDNLADPFEVSPQLRAARRGAPPAFSVTPTASKLDIRRRIQVKALLITPKGRMAQLEIDGAGARSDANTLTVMDGELVDLGDLGTYVVHISARDGVSLGTPGNPNAARMTLR